MRRVLVTGANGFVGRPCVARLVEAGFEVHAVSRTAQSEGAAKWHTADLLSPGAARRLIDAVRPTHLLGLAWCTTPGAYWTSPQNADWLRAGIELADAFSGERAVFTGTCAEYDWQSGVCVEGVTPLEPATLYGRCKRDLCEAIQARLSSWSWARLFWLYGPHEQPQRFVPSVIRALLAGAEIPCSEGTQQRDFLHVGDAAAALVRLLESDHQGPLNVASGRAVAVREVAEIIGRKLNGTHLIRFGARPSTEAPCVLADTRKLSAALGWTPALGLDEGLDATIDWWRKNP